VGVVNANANVGTPSSNPDMGFHQLKRERDEVADVKQPRTACGQNAGNSYFVSLQFTWSGCLLLTLDIKSQLNLYKIHTNIDASKL